MRVPVRVVMSVLAACASAGASRGDVIQFFDASQAAAADTSGVTWDTITSNGYRFKLTRDKLFTGGTGQVIGRTVLVNWPQGVEAEAVTTPPGGGAVQSATITLTRVDGQPFDLTSFTANLLANTAGAGGSIEVMPLLKGQDGLQNPAVFDATGYAGNTFHYDTTTPTYLGNTSSLVGFDTYQMTLYVDFALTTVAVNGAPTPEPTGVGLVAAAGMSLTKRRRRHGARMPLRFEGRKTRACVHAHGTRPDQPASRTRFGAL